MSAEAFEIGARVRTNAAYMAVGGPRARRKPFSGLVVMIYKHEPGFVRVLKDGNQTPSRYRCEWFDGEPHP